MVRHDLCFNWCGNLGEIILDGFKKEKNFVLDNNSN